MNTNFKALAIVAATWLAFGAAHSRELRMADLAPAPSPWGKTLQAFADKVGELSGGKLTIKVFAGGQLGDEKETTSQAVRGRLDLVGASNTGASLVVPEYALLAAPYIWDNTKQGDCVTDNHLDKIYTPLFTAKGLVPLAWTEIGNQIVFSTFPVKSPSDLKGKKVRTAPVKTDTIYMNATGANAVPLGGADSMPALKTGGVSAATWPTVFGIAVGYHKVATNVTVTKHSHQTGAYLVSKRTWDSLSKQEKGWILQARDTVISTLRGKIRGAEGALLKKAAEDGATVTTLSETDAKAWRSIAGQVTAQVVKETGGQATQVWAQLNEAKKACSK
jgi:TRAP-type C4-dicarboxylate transport system substrate-binding protein